MYLCSETPEKSGERGRPAEGGKVDAERGEGKDEAEAEVNVEAPVVTRTTTKVVTREMKIAFLTLEAVGGGVGAAEGGAADVDPAGGEVRMKTAVGGGVEEEGTEGEGVEGEVSSLCRPCCEV